VSVDGVPDVEAHRDGVPPFIRGGAHVWARNPMSVILSTALIALMLLTCYYFLWLTPGTAHRALSLGKAARIDRLVRRECAQLDRDYERLLGRHQH
jgi:hypothetical protein